MPQASQETLDAWPHGEGEALQLLEKNFNCESGWFSVKDTSYEATPEEVAALNYLIEEWDYGYKPTLVERQDESAKDSSLGRNVTPLTYEQRLAAERKMYQTETLKRREPRMAMLSVACWNPSDEERVREAARIGQVVPGERIQTIVETARLSFATRKESLVAVHVDEKRLRLSPSSEWKGAESTEEVQYREAAQEILFDEWHTLHVVSAVSGFGLDNVLRDWIEKAVEDMYAIVEGNMIDLYVISNVRKLAILRSLIMAKGSFAVVGSDGENKPLELNTAFAALVEPVAKEPNDLWFLEKPKVNKLLPLHHFQRLGHGG